LRFFGYFTEPALLIFPVWAANEVYGYFYNNDNDNDNANYMAHLGKLLSGFSVVYLVKNRFVSIDAAYVEKELTGEEIFSLKLEEMWNLAGRFRFDKAWPMGAAMRQKAEAETLPLKI
jgi:hypothetical protein